MFYSSPTHEMLFCLYFIWQSVLWRRVGALYSSFDAIMNQHFFTPLYILCGGWLTDPQCEFSWIKQNQTRVYKSKHLCIKTYNIKFSRIHKNNLISKHSQGKAIPLQSWTEGEVSRFQNNWRKAAFTPQKIFLVLICARGWVNLGL
jgi:hypothetical protein